MSLPVEFPGSKKVAQKTSEIVLRHVIRDVRRKKVQTEKEVNINTEKLQRILTREEWRNVEAWCLKAADDEASETKDKHKRKFQTLAEGNKSNAFKLDRKRVVKNLSNRVLSDAEEQVLALGLNYAIAPTSIPYGDIIASTEATAKNLNASDADRLRHNVSKALHKAKLPKMNLNREMLRAVKGLRRFEDIVILPADKGNATVVMDREEYVEKMNSMLDNTTYRRIKGDPTTRVESKIKKTLKGMEQKGIDNMMRARMTTQQAKPPQIYGLPKIHKEGVPLRPIVSAIGSPTYQLAKELAKILRPLAGRSGSNIKNSSDFCRRIHEMELETDDRMVSFDIVSLYTNVPIDDALEVISSMLHEDDTLEDRTAISAANICLLTELCLRSTYFQFQNQFYEQVDGAAMGSPLSPIVVNLYMENFEQRALETYSLTPKVWIRYVDDTFVVWPHGEEALNGFQTHLNGQHPSIQFTREDEREDKLPFLDVLVKRSGKRIKTSVYRKVTHTDRYIHYTSHHHPKVLSGTIKCLKNRADCVCDEESKMEEFEHLRRTFHANGYPRILIRNALNQPPYIPRDQVQAMDPQTKPKTLCLPYVRHLSEEIQRLCKHLDIRVVFRPCNTLRQLLTKVKTPTPDERKAGVVYEIPCMDCEAVYIGETGRCLEKRLVEHRRAVRNGDRTNGVAVHAWNEDHRVKWTGAKVREVEPHLWRRKTLEAMHIQTEPCTSNLDCGLYLNDVWLPFIGTRKHAPRCLN